MYLIYIQCFLIYAYGRDYFLVIGDWVIFFYSFQFFFKMIVIFINYIDIFIENSICYLFFVVFQRRYFSLGVQLRVVVFNRVEVCIEIDFINDKDQIIEIDNSYKVKQ